MNQEIFSFAMLFAEPVLLTTSTAFYIASLVGKKNKEKKQKIAWGILIFCIVQAVSVIAVTMVLAGR